MMTVPEHGAGAPPPLIDTHAHFVTDDYTSAARAGGYDVPDHMPAWPTWSAAEHLALMDRCGIDRSVLSVSSPGVNFGDDRAAAELATAMNRAAGEIAARQPGRLGFFASLPLPDVGAALAEVGRCADSPGAAGFVVMSNARGVYLGNPDYRALWTELDARAAVVFVHPTAPPNAHAVGLGRPYPMVEFVFDEARTVVDLIFANVLLDFPRIRFVISHSGGALPVIAERVGLFYSPPATHPDNGVRDHLTRLWFDCAGTPLPTALPTLAGVVGRERLLFGSDYCFTRPDVVAVHVDRLRDAGGWLPAMQTNAAQLLGTAQQVASI